MNISCGTDIIEVERIRKNIDSDDIISNKFINRVFTQAEIDYCESKKIQKYQSYAGKFAAKEAIFKAISNNLQDKYSMGWKNIEILSDDQGRPIVNLFNQDKKTKDIEKLIENIEIIDVSISHVKEYAIANVVILYKN